MKITSASSKSFTGILEMDSLYISVSSTLRFTMVASVFNPTDGVRI